MAGPLSGLSAQPQIPLANTQQPNQQAVRQQQEREAQPNQVQPQGAQAAQTQQSETNNQDALQAQVQEFLSASNDGGEQDNQPRGSLIDISV